MEIPRYIATGQPQREETLSASEAAVGLDAAAALADKAGQLRKAWWQDAEAARARAEAAYFTGQADAKLNQFLRDAQDLERVDENGNPTHDTLDEDFDKLANNLRESIEPQIKTRDGAAGFAQRFNALTKGYRTKVDSFKQTRQREYVRGLTLEASRMHRLNGEFDEAAQAVENGYDDGVLSATERTHELQEISDQKQADPINQHLLSPTFDARAALADLKAADLPADKAVRLWEKIHNRVDRDEDEAEKLKEQRQELRASGYKELLANDQSIDRGQLADDRDAGRISVPDFDEIVAKSYANDDEVSADENRAIYDLVYHPAKSLGQKRVEFYNSRAGQKQAAQTKFESLLDSQNHEAMTLDHKAAMAYLTREFGITTEQQEWDSADAKTDNAKAMASALEDLYAAASISTRDFSYLDWAKANRKEYGETIKVPTVQWPPELNPELRDEPETVWRKALLETLQPGDDIDAIIRQAHEARDLNP